MVLTRAISDETVLIDAEGAGSRIVGVGAVLHDEKAVALDGEVEGAARLLQGPLAEVNLRWADPNTVAGEAALITGCQLTRIVIVEIDETDGIGFVARRVEVRDIVRDRLQALG